MAKYLAYGSWIAVQLVCLECMSQTLFRDVDKKELTEIVFDFGANREKFKDYSWFAEITDETHRFFSGGRDTYGELLMICSEDSRSKKLRRDVQCITFHNDEIESESWESVFAVGGKSRRFIGNREYPIERAFSSMKPNEPWNWAIACGSALFHGHAIPSYWAELFDEKRLVAAQQLERLGETVTRGEWKFGKGEKSRLMVYFSSEKGNMPVYCRYHIPADESKPFCDESKVYLNEVGIEWAELGGGWVPITIRNQRDSLNSENGVLMSTRVLQSRFLWGPMASKIEKAFDPEALPSEELFSSITKHHRSRKGQDQ